MPSTAPTAPKALVYTTAIACMGLGLVLWAHTKSKSKSRSSYNGGGIDDDSKTGTKTGTKTDTKTDCKTGTKTGAKTDAKTDCETDTKTGTKTVFLVRHGRSEYNEIYEETFKDPMLFDADLTTTGRAQAVSAGRLLKDQGVQLAVTSPLARAVRTCLLAMPVAENPQVRYDVWADVREHLEASCDIGSSPDVLAREFPEIKNQFSHLPPVWWYVDQDEDTTDPLSCRGYYAECGFTEDDEVFQARVDAVVARILTIPESRIAVFAHADFLNYMLEKHCEQADRWLENCEVVEIQLSSE